jgi:DnaJ like chaperone protein
MSWWGKLIGGSFGFMLGGPLGAILGAALGHNFDRGLDNLPNGDSGSGQGRQQRIQTAFFTATFSVMGHLCKADGLVSKNEIRVATGVMAQMDLSTVQRKAAMALFEQGKQAGFPLDDILRQLRQEIGHRLTLKRMFVEIQCLAACADGDVHATEKKLLLHICTVIGFDRHELDRLLSRITAQSRQSAGNQYTARTGVNDAYQVLGVPVSATDEEVKKAYRRLLSQHHPDKLVSKGLPEEMLKVATQRTHEIRQAYETIRAKRGW